MLSGEFVNVKTRLQVGSGDDFIEIDGYNKWIQSKNFKPGISGWRLSPGGNVEFNNIKARGSLSGRLMNGNHLYIHDEHLITSPKTFAQLYTALKNINITPGETNYNNILCSGFMRIENSAYGYVDFFPRYIRTNNTNSMMLWGSVYENNIFYPHTNFALTSTTATIIISMELLVF